MTSNKFFEAAHRQLTEWCGYDPLPLYLAWLKERWRVAA